METKTVALYNEERVVIVDVGSSTEKEYREAGFSDLAPTPVDPKPEMKLTPDSEVKVPVKKKKAKKGKSDG